MNRYVPFLSRKGQGETLIPQAYVQKRHDILLDDTLRGYLEVGDESWVEWYRSWTDSVAPLGVYHRDLRLGRHSRPCTIFHVPCIWSTPNVARASTPDIHYSSVRYHPHSTRMYCLYLYLHQAPPLLQLLRERYMYEAVFT